jgi:hypothetical protein
MKIIFFTKGIRGSRCLSHILENGYLVSSVIEVIPEKEIALLSDKYDFPVINLDKEESCLNTGEQHHLTGRSLMGKPVGVVQ